MPFSNKLNQVCLEKWLPLRLERDCREEPGASCTKGCKEMLKNLKKMKHKTHNDE
jgi:hypothetical protein